MAASDKPLKTSAGKGASSSLSAKAKTSTSGQGVAKKLDRKVLEGTEDSAYSSEEESGG